MKAVVYTRYGGPEVLRLTGVDIPVPAISAKVTPRARSSSPSGSLRPGRPRARRRASCALAARPAQLAQRYATAVEPALAER